MNQSLRRTYLLHITHSMESFRSQTKVYTMLLNLLFLFLDTPDLITWYIIFVPCEFFVSPCTN
jgi:hypothetical protein